MAKDKSEVFNNDPNTAIVGEISYALRGSGNESSSSTDVNTIMPGGHKKIPQISIGIVSYDQITDALSSRSDANNTDDALHPWNSIGAVGLDALFVPYTNAVSGNFLPHFETPTSTAVGTSLTLDPFNPLNELTVAGKSHTAEDWYDKGHNVSFALNYNPYESGMEKLYPDGDDAPQDFNFEKDFFSRHKAETSGIRAVGLRAPMILSGWGYDTNGSPVPASGGVLHPEATWNPNLWKTGPVDFRWDDARKVWSAGGGGDTTYYLCKVTSTYNPTSFSFEVDRSKSRDQYTRNAPTVQRAFSASDPIYDPEYVAYYANEDNAGQYESLDYAGVEFPFYEAFIVRDTSDVVNSASYYNIWTEDCSDCGVIQNECGASGSATFGAHSGVSTNKKILIENPLRQALDTGDLCFTINTGRTKNVNTGSFSGGSGVGASANLVVDATGGASVDVLASGRGYTAGAFALTSGCDICANVTLFFETGIGDIATTGMALVSGTVDPSTGLKATGTCPIQIIPSNATADTESLPIHWIMQAEFKSQQVVTHAECGGGVLQTCTMKIQTQGFKTCEHCGEDTAFINAY